MVIYQINCTGNTHCETVQRCLFANGYKWALLGQEIREVENLKIFVNPATKQMRVVPICWMEECYGIEEITLSQLLHL